MFQIPYNLVSQDYEDAVLFFEKHNIYDGAIYEFSGESWYVANNGKPSCYVKLIPVDLEAGFDEYNAITVHYSQLTPERRG